MIPASRRFDQSTLASMLEVDPLVQDYRAFFSLFDWSVVDRWLASRSKCCGSHGHPLIAYLKAFLLRIKEGLIYAKQLRLPCRYWFGEKLRHLDRGLLTDLLATTVAALKEEIPGLGEVVAFDVKHIYAWVKENNWRAYVAERFDKTQIPVGDPDCKLGVKRSTNKELADGSTEEKKELIWGYGSGVAAATTPDYGDVVLAEYTLPFNEGDITYFRPLYQQSVVALSQFPTHITADAAYDAQVASMRRLLVMEGWRLFHSMLAAPPPLSPMAPRFAPEDCACTPPSTMLTPTAIALCATVARCSCLKRLERPAIMSNSSKEKGLIRTLCGG